MIKHREKDETFEARKWIGRFFELRNDPSERDKAYATLSTESGLSIHFCFWRV